MFDTRMVSYKKVSLVLLAALMLLAFLAAFAPHTASAHGRRTLANGKYQVIFGFLNEPAYTGQQNAALLEVCEGTCETNPDGKLKNPVKDVQKTLKAQIIQGSQTLDMELTARFGFDGHYLAYFFPGRAGDLPLLRHHQ